MSEKQPSMELHYVPSDPEAEPAMKLSDGDKEILATRFNTKLYTFLGHTALNHVFVTYELNTTMRIGSRVWAHEAAYESMTEYMFDNDYPADLNSPIVSAEDVVAYEKLMSRDLQEAETFIPEGWE